MGYIYKVTNSINNKIYIGQTRRTIPIRWQEHIRDSFHQSRSYTSILHYAIRKYGEQAFIVEEVEQCDNEILNEREIFWINYYDSCNGGYNISHGGNGYLKHEDEELLDLWDSGLSAGEIALQLDLCVDTVTRRLKLCDIDQDEIVKRGYKLIARANQKPIYQYDLDGNFIRGFKNVDEAEKITGIKNIKASSGTIHKIMGGHRWSRQCLEKIETKRKTTNGGRCRVVHQYSIDGEYIKSYDSMIDAANSINIHHGCIRRACTGKSRTSGGYRWSYEKRSKLPPLEPDKNTRRVYRIDKNTGEKKLYLSIVEAAKDNNITSPDIIHVCTGVMPSIKGYCWQYA